jgi:N-acetylmuramoyl-L-alanine amidase
MGWLERAAAVVAGLAMVAVVSTIVGANADEVRRTPATALAKPAPPRPSVTALAAAVASTPEPQVTAAISKPKTVGAVTTIAGTVLRTKPWLSARAIGPVPEGVLAPVLDQRWGFYKVLTPNENIGWLHKKRVITHEKAKPNPRRLEDATIVIDPGHGGHLPGAVGPGGLTEKDVNLAISRAAVAKLTGARVFLTRTERHAGIAYRSGLANRLGAVAFVSIHNNSAPARIGSKVPGAEVYHRVDHDDSKRLARLIHAEIVQVLKDFKIGWGRNAISGAKFRRSHQHGGDYYGVLRRANVPAVIVENMFISNKQEEKLLRRADVHDVLAEAIARGITDFIETDA